MTAAPCGIHSFACRLGVARLPMKEPRGVELYGAPEALITEAARRPQKRMFSSSRMPPLSTSGYLSLRVLGLRAAV